MSESPLAVMEPQQIVNVVDHALSVEQLIAQRELIARAMKGAMIEGQHYGKIAGCGDKPTLLQPGAQLLSHLFRLRPEYEIIETDLPNQHKRFRVTCRLFFIGSQPEIKISEGVGESSSMESKHRFRNAAAIVEWTDDPVPAAYWDLSKKDKSDGGHRAKDWLAKSYEGAHVGPKKDDKGNWRFVKFIGGDEKKVENSNPPDVFNTVLKIAKKRAYVDATITATASSDFFTQDLEDIRANLDAVEVEAKVEKPAQAGEKRQESASKPQTGSTQRTDSMTHLTGTVWRDVVCSFGRKDGPIRGKQLGDLNEQNLKYLAELFLDGDKKIDAKDQPMVDALKAWRDEKSGAKKAAPVAGNERLNLDKLDEDLAWKASPEISKETFMKAAHQLMPERIPKHAKFDNMSEETAKIFLDDFENVAATCHQLMKEAGK